jgi:hypothetical protein
MEFDGETGTGDVLAKVAGWVLKATDGFSDE